MAWQPERLERAFAAVERGAQTGAYAGAVATVGNMDGQMRTEAFGWAAVEPERRPMKADIVFDLASVTKLFTTTAVLQMVDAGELWLDMAVQSVIPAFRHPQVQLRHLLTHASGLVGWRPLYLDASGRRDVMATICAEELQREPGAQVEYSDLGFILLGEVVAAVAGAPLQKVLADRIFRPLGMRSTEFQPAGPASRFAATELGNRAEILKCGERADSFAHWRRAPICGQVNDGNCHYALGGISGHAGLFGTAADLARFAQAWLGGGKPLISVAARRLACRLHMPGPNPWGLGWMKPGAGFGAFMGDLVSPEAVGHTGFTGTSVVVDPAAGLYAILLTNRQHVADDDPARIAAVRRRFHNAVFASAQ